VGFSFCSHREPIGHDATIAFGRADGSSIELQESDGVGRSVKAGGRGQPETRHPSHAAESLRERSKAPEAGGATHRLNSLVDGLQGVEDLTTNLAIWSAWRQKHVKQPSAMPKEISK
jgi:hypothetical protein